MRSWYNAGVVYRINNCVVDDAIGNDDDVKRSIAGSQAVFPLPEDGLYSWYNVCNAGNDDDEEEADDDVGDSNGARSYNSGCVENISKVSW